MKEIVTCLTVLLLSLNAIFCLTDHVYTIHSRYSTESLTRLGEIPTPLLKLSVLEFKGAAADLLQLKTITWFGMKLIKHQNLNPAEWKQAYKIINNITELDPKFWDPYLFAEMMFTWQAGMIDEANSLLEKAAKALPNDFRPLYFLGFNEFYFRKNAAKAAPYLREAAAKPHAPSFLKGLAARFSLYGNQTLAGIIFLKGLIKQTNDDVTRKYLTKSLETLKLIYKLENAVEKYKKLFNRPPANLNDLITAGIIKKIPQDPFGGRFIITDNGRVYTTSNLLEKKSMQNSQ